MKSDSACIPQLESCSKYFEGSNDTVWLIRSLYGIAIHSSREGNYNSAFSNLWKALYYAEELNNFELLFLIHNQLGTLFYIFDKDQENLLHLQQALFYVKKSIEKEGKLKEEIVSANYGFVHYYRKVGDYDRSLAYLDTCNMYADSLMFTNDQRAFHHSERGNIYRKMGKLDEALEILLEAEGNFKRISPGYLPIVYFYLGSTYMEMQRWSKAEESFKKAVENIDKYNTHFDAKSESLSRLAFCMNKQYRFKEAYKVLRKSKEIYDNTFSSKSYLNAGLFDIRNMYKEQLKERDFIILERDKELARQKAKILRVRMIFIGAFAMLTIAALFWYLRIQRKKFEIEKEKQKMQASLEQEKTKALVELKNRELTSFTLRLIDKDSLINDMVGDIKEYAPSNGRLLKSVKGKTTGRIKLWEEFDKRFLDVNKGFYENLKVKYPELTPTELKHCALIKLNFSAKEMAQLLNISANGVNTSRYRIRKKLKLEREENLTTVIGEL